MAMGNLALPVGHVPVTDATAPALSVCLGKPFRQPVDLPDSAQFSSGLELWLFDDDPDFRLFAMFDGELSFIPAAASGQPHMLQLKVDAGTQRIYNQIPGLLEPVPYTLVYENVNKDLVNIAIRDLIEVAYAATNGITNQWSWHPILRSQWNGTQLKLSLDAANTQGGNAFGAELDKVMSYIMEPLGPVYPAFSVLAGDHIGAAATPLATDQAPAGCTFAASAARVTIMTKEYAQNKLNPTYYIWRFLKNAYSPQSGDIKVQVITRAPLQPDQSFDHPLLKTLNLNLNTTIKPRIETSALLPGQANPTNVLLFPTGPLSTWDGVQWAASAQSTIEWHITNDANLQFETRLKTGVSVANLQGVDISATPLASQQTLIQQVWSAWGDAINETCMELQFPAELTAVTIAHESFNNPRAVRLEPLVIPTTIAKGANDPKRNQELRLQNQGVSQTVIDGYKNLTIIISPTTGQPCPVGFSTLSGPGPSPSHGPDPNQWPGTSTIYAARSTLTWDDLLQIIDVVPERMSPGLMQTLVSEAIAKYTWLQKWYSDIPGTFGVADPFAAGPPSPSDWFRWLIIGPHSILLGTTCHKHAYTYEGSRMNLPRIASLYNAGQRKVAGQIEPNDAPQLKDPDIAGNPTKPNPWRMRYNNLRYPRDVTREYNAISSQFNTGVNGLARFWRTLP